MLVLDLRSKVLRRKGHIAGHIPNLLAELLRRPHRATEFRKFLAKIDTEVPEGLEVHLICDNYQTHKTPVVQTWLRNHPRFHMHFTPTYSSWLNQVERFFGFVTEDLLRRSDHRSVQALEADIRKWVSEWNTNPTPSPGQRPLNRSSNQSAGF